MPRARLLQIASAIRAQATTATRGGERTPEELDSLMRLELVLKVEEEFGIDFSESELASVTTLDALDAALERKLSAAMPIANATPVENARETSRGERESPASSAPLESSLGHAMARVLIPAAMRLWFRMTITGAEHWPANGAFLLCANHRSHLDSLVLFTAAGARREHLVFPAARDYFFFGRRLARIATRGLRLVPLDRAGQAGALKTNLRELEICAAQARVIVLYPEGTRSADDELQPFKDGLHFFSQRLQLPVMPCWIHGTGRALPRGARWPRPGRIGVSFGRLLPAARPEDATFVGRVREAMLALRAS